LPHSVAHGLDGLAHRIERDAPRQRLEPRKRGAEIVDRGLQRTLVLRFDREGVRPELRAPLD
jgi:hypothetical protein